MATDAPIEIAIVNKPARIRVPRMWPFVPAESDEERPSARPGPSPSRTTACRAAKNFDSGYNTGTKNRISPTMIMTNTVKLTMISETIRWPTTLYAAATRERLADLDYDFARLRALMTARDWVTIALVFRRDQTTYDARNPFPTGGVVEDPATGAAAAAFGAYLRALGAIDPPARLTIHQGDDLGRPSLLLVDIPVGAETGIRVSGRAVPIDQVQEGSTI
jgi:hypothetical protein